MSKTRKKAKPRTFEGLPVVDGVKSFELQISKDDVKGSRKNDPANCAAARACQRKFKREVRVFLTRTYVKEKNNWIRFLTPEAISREITSFDRGASFEPGKYEIKAPYESAKLGNHHGRSYETGTGKTKQTHHITANIRPSAKTGYSAHK